MPLNDSAPSRRDDAVRLRDILRGVKAAKSDARDFALFDARDALHGLGVDHAQIDGFDAHDDAALDKHIADAHAVATALGAPDDEDHSALFGGDGVETLAGGMGDDTVNMTASNTLPVQWWKAPALARQAIVDATERGANSFMAAKQTGERIADEEVPRSQEQARLAKVVDRDGRPIALDNEFDAERHARWSYRMAREINPAFATAAGIGHEITGLAKFPSLGEVLMDLHNNGVGIGQARAGGGMPDLKTPGLQWFKGTNAKYPNAP